MLAMMIILAANLALRADAPISDATAREKAKQAIREVGQGSSPLYTKRREEFEEEILEYEVSIFEGHVAKGVFAYEVSEAGCEPELNEKGSRSCSVVMDADPRWYVLVSKESGIAYRVSGFKDSQTEFNRMALDLHIRLRDAAAVERYGQLFLGLHYGPETSMGGPHIRFVANEFAARQAAEEDFHWSYKESEYEQRFGAWWKRFTARRPKLGVTAEIDKEAQTYEVSVPVLKMMNFSVPPFKRLDDAPTIMRIHVVIGINGSIGVMEAEPIFPSGSARKVALQ